MSDRRSSMTIDVRKALMLERLLKAWEKRPELGLGQLLAGALTSAAPESFVLAHLLRVSDSELAEAVEKFVLMERA